MAIRVKGANRKFTSEEILKRCIGMKDKYGNPFEIINLDWNPAKFCGHATKTKGDFDDVMLIRTKRGTAITYRTPGSLEFLKDGFTGFYSAMVARTDKNLYILGSMYYDKLWTIREPHIDKIVKVIADKIDEGNKLVEQTHTVVVYEEQPNGTQKRVEKRVKETLYEVHKRRREGHFKGPRGAGDISRPLEMNLHQEQMTDKKEAELNVKIMDIEKREALLKDREAALSIPAPIEDNINEPVNDLYTREDLLSKKFIPVSKLKKLAKDEFGIDNAHSLHRDVVVDKILETQAKREAELEPEESVVG